MENDIRYRTLSRIVHASAFLVEREEESGALRTGDTVALNWMAPVGMSAQDARSFQHQVIRPAQLSATPAALALRRILLERGLTVAELPTESEIVQASEPLERHFSPVNLDDTALRLDRAVMRGVRYIWQIHTIKARQHSRIFDSFVPDGLIPRGRSAALVDGEKIHREHVVPCCELLILCRTAFEQLPGPRAVVAPHQTVRELTGLVRSLLAIVEITPREAAAMDAVHKWSMPEGWQAESGCLFERLHRWNIAFEMSSNSLQRHPDARCACQG